MGKPWEGWQVTSSGLREGPTLHPLPVPWVEHPGLWASVSPSAVMAQLTGVLAGRRKRARPWLLGITHDEAAPAGLGLPLPASSWPSGKFTLRPHTLVALETRSPW